MNWAGMFFSVLLGLAATGVGSGASAGDARPTTPTRLRVLDSSISTAPPEEFVGPFANWLDVRRDFGAAGDGLADDTDALQTAFDAIRAADAPPVLFLPAGTYRITRMLEIKRSGHSDSKDILILGEHPDRTVLRWDGPMDGTMLKFGAWWSRLGRLTFDGKGRARCGIAHGDLFTSINELSDLVIQNVNIGIEAGTMTGAAVAETVVLRCRFQHCATAGISLGNWNSLDWFIWDSEFTDCRLGVANIFGAGHFHVYRSIFQRSTEADMAIGNTSYFSIRNCTSWRSKAFFTAGASGAPALLTLQSNTILEPQGTPIVIGNAGPLLMLDNVVRGSGQPAMTFDKIGAGLLSAGNIFSINPPHTKTTNVLAFDNVFAGTNENGGVIPERPGTPPSYSGPALEMPTNATRLQIQQAIDGALDRVGARLLIHLPAGLYFIDRELVIPPSVDLTIAGDGGKTILKWTGPASGAIWHLMGPTHAVLRDLRLHGSEVGTCVRITGCDQDNARLLLEQVDVRHHSTAGLRVRGLARAHVHAQSFYHSNSRLGVDVAGVPGSLPTGSRARVALFGGASSDNQRCYDITDSGQLLVQDTWYETRMPQYPAFLHCTNSGVFTLHGASVAPQYSVLSPPSVLIDSFRGRATFLATTLVFPNTKFAARHIASADKVLVAGMLGPIGPELPSNHPGVAQLACARSSTSGGATALTDRGPRDPVFLREMLQQTREEKPRPLTQLQRNVADVRLHRVFAESGEIGILIEP